MFSDKLQLSLINKTTIKNLIGDSQYAEGQAGFVKNGHYAWIVRDSTLEVLSTDSGVKLAHYNFGKHHGARGCIITCVEEIDYLPEVCLLAIATEFTASGASTGVLSLFCVQGSKIIGSMDFCEKITCCRYIERSACQRSILRNFRGTVAIGTDQGKMFLIDLMLPSSHEISSLQSLETELFPCINVYKENVDQTKIANAHQKVSSADHAMGDRAFFSIQLEVLNDSGSILSILSMPNLYTMAAGLNDGRLILFDLTSLQPFHLAYPPNKRAPLTHMSFLEPTDDPRCAVYLWAFHTTSEGAVAVMHSLMFASRVGRIYEQFKTCSVRLTMPILVKDIFPICCHSIIRTLTQDEEDVLTLNVFGWTSPAAKKTTMMLFDLNQWYKEEMPSLGDWRLQLKYTAVFELQDCTSLDIFINENSVFPFNSNQRPEEHFYPNSLSFDVCVLENDKFSNYRWFGLQNIALQQFNVIGPQIIFEPSYYFNELLQVAIVPQFSDVIYSVSTPMDQKREFLLSVALEYNFNGFLKKCAWSWADGSYLGKDRSTGIGLSTLTDWIWNRAREIKEICNTLCKPLFDFSEQRIDYGTQKQLSQCSKQLKVLSDLLIIVLKDYRHFIPEHILTQLETQSETIKMASDYQEVLQWLLNVGLLPEGHYYSGRDQHLDDEFVIVPYPYQIINSYYHAQRIKLADEWNDDPLKLKERSSKNFLFIDAFIEQECSSAKFSEIWSNKLYPPQSIQALLRTLLVPDICISKKHVIFVYLFMDITSVLSEGEYSSIVRNLIKFPAVFKMNPAMIKRTQAFWNLDNGHLENAVEELISPLSHDKHLPLWQRELLIGALLKHNANSLALRALRCPGNQISPDLEVLTLLSNNLLSEALKVQRATGDYRLLEKLFAKILHSPNYEQLLDLTLTEDEGAVLGEYLMKLKDSGLPNHLNIHFVFLLQRSKFLDAAHLVESLGNDSNMNLEPPKQVLNAYYASMEPTTRRLTSMAYREDVQVQESPLPLSVSLIRSKCNAKNDIYQKCVQSITEAAHDNTIESQKLPFIGSPKLGIFEYRQPTVSYNDLSYNLEVNEHGKRKQKNQEIIRLEDLEAPQQKKRRLNDSVEVKKRKSYMDMRIANLTVFKEIKPNFTFAKRNSGTNTTPRTTPDRVKTFGNFLNTPIIQKKTPPMRLPEKCPTPHSILKTRSCRGSVSPAPSRFSEFGDDNKSVKSITFAALPDSRDNSFNESSIMEESFADEPMESSADNFYSPEKNLEEKKEEGNSQSIVEGPKVRKPIKSRSTTPTDQSQNLMQRPEKAPPARETVQNQEVEEAFAAKDDESTHSKKAKLDISISSDEELAKPFRRKSVLREDNSSFDDSEDDSDSSVADKSIYNYVRKSVLPADYEDEWSEDSSVSEMVEDEQFKEEELPEHSDYNENSSEEFGYGNDVDLNDSDESESQEPQTKDTPGEVICLDSSSDEEVPEPAALPSFYALDKSVEAEYNPVSQDYTEHVSSTTAVNAGAVSSQEEMLASLYDDIIERGQDENEVEIESPPFEEVEQGHEQFSLIERSEEPNSTSQDTRITPDVPLDLAIPYKKEKKLEPETSKLSGEPKEESLLIESPENDEAAAPSKSFKDNIEPEDPIVEAPEKQEVVQEKVIESASIAEEQKDEPSIEELLDPLQKRFLSPAVVKKDQGSAKQVQQEATEHEVFKAPERTEVSFEVSEVSEDFSFATASAGELNEGLLMSEVTGEASNITNELTVEKSEDADDSNKSINLLDQAQIVEEISMETARDSLSKSEILEETNDPFNTGQVAEDSQVISQEVSPVVEKPTRKRARDRSISIEQSDRLTRASSMPINESSTSVNAVSRSRAATEDREAPSKKKKVKTSEKIEDNAASGILTRSKSQLLEKQNTPETPVRITRRMSHLSEDGRDSPQTTPRRMTRAASKDSQLTSGSEKSPEEPGQLKRQLSKRGAQKRATSVLTDDNDDGKSTKSSVRSTRSSAKRTTPTSSVKLTPEKTSPVEELTVSNRRLTRNQLQVLEKSRQLTEKLNSAAALRATKSEVTVKLHSQVDDSDNESVKSESGSTVSSRASVSRKRKGRTKDALSIIPEESHEESSESSMRRRTLKK